MRLRILFGASACMFLLAANVSAGESTFRWRDAQGQVHYSNLLPPDALDRGYEVIDGSGNIVKRVPPPLTPAQRAAVEAEAKRLEKQAADRAEEARRDNMLLRTFNSVHDIERLRDNRISALDAQLRLVREHQHGLERRLAELQGREGKLSANKRGIPADLSRELDDVRSELDDSRKTQQAMEVNRADIRRRFEDDIVRFKMLQAEGRVPQ